MSGGGRIGIDWDAQPLGTVPDSTLAKQLGCSVNTVRSARYHRGIEAFQGQKRPKGIDWSKVELTGASSEAIGRRLGVSSAAVRQARARRGLTVRVRTFEDFEAGR